MVGFCEPGRTPCAPGALPVYGESMGSAGGSDAAQVAIVVLNWNGWRDTLECLEALDRLESPHSVILVDNGSTDGSLEELRSRRPDTRILETGRNLGYAGGNNVGITAALEDGSDFVWVLNNDAQPDPDSLGHLLSAMRPGVGILAARLEPRTLTTALLNERGVYCEGCEEGFHEADMVLGASLFFRVAVFEEVGLFEESYFHFYEEQDLALRTLRAGYQLGFACRARVAHDGGASLEHFSPQASYYLLRNRIAYSRRFYGWSVLATLRRSGTLLRAHLALKRSLRDRDPRRTIALLLAITDATRRRSGYRDLGGRYQHRRPQIY